MIQRYVSLPTIRQAKKALWILTFGYGFVTAFAIYNGFLMSAKYYDCDPLSTGVVKQADQIVPLLVMETVGKYPAFTGLFVAGIFSASLSTISTSFNSMSAVFLEDFIKLGYKNRDFTDNEIGFMLRACVVFSGLFATVLSFVLGSLGPILGIALSIPAITNGPLMGVFLIGLTMPWIGSTSTLIGAICGLFSTSFVVLKSQIDKSLGTLSFEMKPFSVDGCHYSFNATTLPSAVESANEFYHISYLYHSFFGVLVTIVIAAICSLFIKNEKTVDPALLTPVVRKMYASHRNRYSIDHEGHNMSLKPLVS